jgi:hypothetical protein
MTVTYPHPQIEVGTKYMTRGAHPVECTVTDVLSTYNLSGKLVKTRYVARHTFCDQLVTDYDVCATTIKRGVAAVEIKNNQ